MELSTAETSALEQAREKQFSEFFSSDHEHRKISLSFSVVAKISVVAKKKSVTSRDGS